jgi:hypothetical protein
MFWTVDGRPNRPLLKADRSPLVLHPMCHNFRRGTKFASRD